MLCMACFTLSGSREISHIFNTRIIERLWPLHCGRSSSAYAPMLSPHSSPGVVLSSHQNSPFGLIQKFRSCLILLWILQLFSTLFLNCFKPSDSKGDKLVLIGKSFLSHFFFIPSRVKVSILVFILARATSTPLSSRGSGIIVLRLLFRSVYLLILRSISESSSLNTVWSFVCVICHSSLHSSPSLWARLSNSQCTWVITLSVAPGSPRGECRHGARHDHGECHIR